VVFDPERGCVRGRRSDESMSDILEEMARMKQEEKQKQPAGSAPSANDYQIGGDHYKKIPGEQHWDRVARLGLNYFQAMITRYVERYRHKNGVEDLKKARHFLDKLIELEESGALSRSTVESEDKQKATSGETPVGRDASLMHCADHTDLDVAICGANYAGMKSTDDVHAVTCPDCLLRWSST
jgi:hypothetical protein